MKRLKGILIALFSLVLLVPSFSTAQMMMKHDQMMSPSQSMGEMKMEEMHKMMPRMMRHMMDMMHEMMGMMKETVQEEKDKEKLEGMMKHMERMMKGYDEAVKGTDNKTMGEAYESGTPTETTGAKESGALTKKAEAGGVTAEVTYLNPGEDNPAFEIKFDTHSAELDQYKLEGIVSLRDETGREYSTPIVESPSGSGHHRSGVLRFKDADISKAEAIELVIKDVAEVKERVFRFEIKK